MLKNFRLETWTYWYIMLFFLLVGMNFFSFLFRNDGMMVGGFNLAEEANVLHLLSGMWAATALWYSRNAMLYYFRIFGTVYFLDGMVGVIAGKAFLNLNLFDAHTHAHAEMSTRLLLNIPHLVIGGLAMFVGFILFKKYTSQ